MNRHRAPISWSTFREAIWLSWPLTTRMLCRSSREAGPYLIRNLTLVSILLTFTHRETFENFGAPGQAVLGGVFGISNVVLVLQTFLLVHRLFGPDERYHHGPLMKLTTAGIEGLYLSRYFAVLVDVLLLMIVQVPFVLLSITLGGVAWSQIAVGYVVLVAHSFFTVSLAAHTEILTSGKFEARVVLLIWLVLILIMNSFSYEIPFFYPTGMHVAIVNNTYSWYEPIICVFGLLAFGLSFMRRVLGVLPTKVGTEPLRPPSVEIFVPVATNATLSLKSFRRSSRFRPDRQILKWKYLHFHREWEDMMMGRAFIYGLPCLMLILGICKKHMDHYSEPGSVIYPSDAFYLVLRVILGFLAVEVSYLSTQLFAEELQQDIWPSLKLLPYRGHELVHQVFVATGAKLIPGVAALMFVNILVLWFRPDVLHEVVAMSVYFGGICLLFGSIVVYWTTLGQSYGIAVAAAVTAGIQFAIRAIRDELLKLQGPMEILENFPIVIVALCLLNYLLAWWVWDRTRANLVRN